MHTTNLKAQEGSYDRPCLPYEITSKSISDPCACKLPFRLAQSSCQPEACLAPGRERMGRARPRLAIVSPIPHRNAGASQTGGPER